LDHTIVEVAMRAELDTFIDDLPDMDPVIATETTHYGWRGLTSGGEVLEVKGGPIPDNLTVACAGLAIGRRKVTNDTSVDISDYLRRFNGVVDAYKANRLDEALSMASLVTPPTIRSKFNRAMVLLAAGRWHEGLHEYWECEQFEPFMRPQVKEALELGLKPWMGETTGKGVVIMHAHGFGDTLMMLRFLPRVRALERVSLLVPRELRRLVQGDISPAGCEYYCPILHLLHFLNISPQDVRSCSYIRPDSRLVERWLLRINSPRKKIGIAWSVGKPSVGDYPREMPLETLVSALRGSDVELHSVQAQGEDEARALGVKTHHYDDFADCAAVMSLMDEIVSVDTAALHLAGAIGHPKVFALLSHWHSWRWIAPWYENVKLCVQLSPGDWLSSIAQVI